MRYGLRLALAAVLLVAANGARGQSFILEPGPIGYYPADIYAPGGVGGLPPPMLIFPGVAAGGPLGVNAISYGRPLSEVGLPFVFSVSGASMGAPGTAVALQAGFGEAASDIFLHTGAGANALLFDGNGIAAPTGATGAPLGIPEPGPNVNAFDIRTGMPGDLIYFSVDPYTAGVYGGLAPGASAANVYFSPFVPEYDTPVPAVYAPFAALGLMSDDDIDALIVFDDGIPGFGPDDVIQFSLAPGSPSLLPLFAGPGDILEISGLGGLPIVVATAADLGLSPIDNVNALDVLVPEPAVGAVLFVALALLPRRRRRWNRACRTSD